VEVVQRIGLGHDDLLGFAANRDYISRVSESAAIPVSSSSAADRSLARLAWTTVAINVGVILWGAVVRATGSGAGCGSHWPLCNGEVVPQSPRLATMIEFGHRLTSGVALLAVAWLFARVLRAHRGPGAREKKLRRLAWLSLVFILGEAAIGAGLVLFEYVGENSSPARAAWMAFHLMNTFLLLGSLALLADRLRRGGDRRSAPGFSPGPMGWTGLAALALSGASGGVAALGDTLFPATSLAAGLAQDLSPASHFLLRLRTFHPLLAVAAGLFWLWLAQESRRRAGSAAANGAVRQAANAVTLLVFAQLGVGLINLGLLAPVPLQVLHLLLADLLWIAAVLLLDRESNEAPDGQRSSKA
jgi:heme A synthase